MSPQRVSTKIVHYGLSFIHKPIWANIQELGLHMCEHEDLKDFAANKPDITMCWLTRVTWLTWPSCLYSLLFTSTYSMAPHFLSIIIFGQRYCINSFEWFKTLKWILLLFFVWFIWINWWQLEEKLNFIILKT